MKKSVLIIGIVLLFLLPSVQSFSFQSFEFFEEFGFASTSSLFESQNTLTIHNPYEGVDFESVNHFKANLHTHTKESDGSSFPGQVIYHYHLIGNYSILAITDHNKNTWPWTRWIAEVPISRSSSSELYARMNMLAVSGNELSLGHHRGSWFNDFSGGGFFMRFAFWQIARNDGLSIFYHPGRYDKSDKWYEGYFERFDDVLIGLEVYNQGDRYSGDRLLWDRLNKNREPDDLLWGFSDDDMHNLDSHAFRNYQHFLMQELSEEELRESMLSGAFYFSYEPEGNDGQSPFYGIAMTPKLVDVSVVQNTISVVGEDVESIEWFGDSSELIGVGPSIDVSLVDSNFVRAVLSNEYGLSYTQPFGISRGK